MGCCFSSEEDKDSGYQDPTERTRLLDPNARNASPPSQGNGRQQYGQENEKGDEQSALARILHQNERDVIDVASNQTTIEQHEYHDRARQYSTRLKVVMANSGRQGSFRMVLPAGVTNPLAVLGAPPLSPAEIQLICSTAEKVAKATREVRVQHREDLVVSFGVPVP